jgi:hypothetical protein
MNEKQRICPLCKGKYTDFPALSRRDNKAEICSGCGELEALIDFFIWRAVKRGEVTHEELMTRLLVAFTSSDTTTGTDPPPEKLKVETYRLNPKNRQILISD